MTGRTNANTGVGGSAFLAYLQVATDPNAVITAVNLAGDTFSGTADSEGSLVLNITEPGTYTVTETDGGVETIVIADNGETYQLTVVAFDADMIIDGVKSIPFISEAYSVGSSAGVAPTIEENVVWNGYNTIKASVQGKSSGIYISRNSVDITEYSQIEYYVMQQGTYGSPAVVAVAEDDTYVQLNYVITNSTRTISISALDTAKRWQFGFMVYCSQDYDTVALFIKDFRLR